MIGIIMITIIIIIIGNDNYPPYINGNKNNKNIFSKNGKGYQNPKSLEVNIEPKIKQTTSI